MGLVCPAHPGLGDGALSPLTLCPGPSDPRQSHSPALWGSSRFPHQDAASGVRNYISIILGWGVMLKIHLLI